MAERFQPPPQPPFIAASTTDNQQLPPNRLYQINDNKVALQIVLPASNDTYIVQMPKDQIYRVPPPENAAVVERHRHPPQKSPRRRCSPCACYAASTLFAVAILALISFLIYKFTLSPQSPTFVIKSFSVSGNPSPNPNPNPKSASAHHAPPMYHVGIEATNPNAVNWLVYMAGTAELLLGGRGVAKGHSPAITQGGKQIDDFEVALVGRAGSTVPTAIQRSVDYMAGKKGVKLNLTMSLHMKKKTWLTNQSDLVLVKCEFVAESVPRQKGSATVTSQSCAYF